MLPEIGEYSTVKEQPSVSSWGASNTTDQLSVELNTSSQEAFSVFFIQQIVEILWDLHRFPQEPFKILKIATAAFLMAWNSAVRKTGETIMSQIAIEKNRIIKHHQTDFI